MKTRLKIILIALVVVPLITLIWLLQFFINSSQLEVNKEYQVLRFQKMVQQTNVIQKSVNLVIQDLNQNGRTSPFSKEYFEVSSDGSLRSWNTTILDSTKELWEDNRFYNEVLNANLNEKQHVKNSGWLRFMKDSTMTLYYWQKNGSKCLVHKINYAALLAEIIGNLNESAPHEMFVLKDFSGNLIYHWGDTIEEKNFHTMKQTITFAPFDSYRILLTLDKSKLPENRVIRSLEQKIYYLTFFISFTFIVMAIYFYRSSNREFNAAQKKVSFVNRVSHELKTPLTNIRLYTELLETKFPENNHLKVISAESNRLSRLIHNVLTFSKLKRSEQTVHKQPVLFPDFLDNFLEIMTFSLQQKGFEIEITNKLSGQYLVDGDLIKQVLGNLISNVEKYSDEDKSLKLIAELKNNQLSFTVEDRGIGISAKEMTKIFTPFYRCNNKLSAGVSGSGIGLTLSRELCALHNGTLTAERLPVGTKFIATFSLEK